MKMLLKVLGFASFLIAAVMLYAERGRILRRSTLQLLIVSHGRQFIHAYIYARWPSIYIGTALKHLLPRYTPQQKQGAAESYHGKVLPTQLAKRLVSVQRDIPIRDVEQILPYPIARDLVLKGPPEIVAFECPCRATRVNPCRPTQVCMIVGQPFVDFVLEHHPSTSRRLTTPQAVEMIEDEHQRGHIHAAYFKDAMLGRFYAICNCCKCCCGGIEAMARGIPMLASSGFVAEVDPEQCLACGDCEKACPFGAISVGDHSTVNWDACMGCGVCEGQCPTDAIRLVRDERKGIPLEVAIMG